MQSTTVLTPDTSADGSPEAPGQAFAPPSQPSTWSPEAVPTGAELPSAQSLDALRPLSPIEPLAQARGIRDDASVAAAHQSAAAAAAQVTAEREGAATKATARIQQRIQTDAQLAQLLRQCGAAETTLLGLQRQCQRRIGELASVDAALAEARIELQSARASSLAQVAELRAQRRVLQEEALIAAEASAAERGEVQALRTANADARAQLEATKEALESLRAQHAEKKQRCEELTVALQGASKQLLHSQAKLESVQSSLAHPAPVARPHAAAGASAVDASKAIALLLRQTLEAGAKASPPVSPETAIFRSQAWQQLQQQREPRRDRTPVAPDPARVNERLARARGGRGVGKAYTYARPDASPGRCEPPLSASLPTPPRQMVSSRSSQDLGV